MRGNLCKILIIALVLLQVFTGYAAEGTRKTDFKIEWKARGPLPLKPVIPARVPILMYHSISTPLSQRELLCLSPDRFAAQLDYLAAEGYETITLAELYAATQNRRHELPKKPIILTFDDGYLDNYTQAFPILEERDMVGVFFPYYNKIGTANGMTSEQLREMAEAGHEIGCHTLTHPDLRYVGKERLKREVIDAKTKLSELLDLEIVSFSYPGGAYTEAVADLVAEHYLAAVGTESGYGKIAKPFTLDRIRIFSYDTPDRLMNRINRMKK